MADLDDPATTRILQELVAHGWQRTGSSEAIGRANLVYETDTAELEVDYLPDEPAVSFMFEGDEDEHELWIVHGDDLDGLLRLVVEEQDRLSSESWEGFAARVASQFPQTREVFGDDESSLLVDPERGDVGP
jgi:hypothetical protein